jgi:hypothetical protein
MTVTVPQTISILSNGKYTVGPGGTVSTEDEAILESLIADEVARKNPGFSETELVRYKAYLILDILSNTPGMGSIVEKKVNLVSWKIAKSSVKGSTSVWMDFAERMISGFGTATMPAGVSRADAYVNGLDSTEVAQYGGPSDAPI